MSVIASLVKDWGGFEKLVASLHETGEVSVERDVKLLGRSGAKRQIDVLVRHKQGLYTHLVVVECKYWNKRVKRQDVDALAATVREVGASKGVIFSTKGFQEGAITQAAAEAISLFQVRDLTNEEWGLPGRVVDFYLQLIQGSVGNPKLDIKQTYVIRGRPVDKPVNLTISIGGEAKNSRTLIAKKTGLEKDTLEEYVEETATRALSDALKDKFFRLEGDGDVDQYMQAHVSRKFDPPILPIADGVMIELVGIEFDLGIKIHQTRFVADRGANFAFALAVEDKINGITSTASRHKDADVTVLSAGANPEENPTEKPMENGSIMRIFHKGFFDFSEMGAKHTTPHADHFLSSNTDPKSN